METMKLLKKIKNLVKYYIGPKDQVFEAEFNKYLPNNIMDSDGFVLCVWRISFDRKSINAVLTEYMQEHDV